MAVQTLRVRASVERIKTIAETLRVTSRWLVEFLDTVRVSFCDYAAASSGIATSSVSMFRSFMECSLK